MNLFRKAALIVLAVLMAACGAGAPAGSGEQVPHRESTGALPPFATATSTDIPPTATATETPSPTATEVSPNEYLGALGYTQEYLGAFDSFGYSVTQVQGSDYKSVVGVNSETGLQTTLAVEQADGWHQYYEGIIAGHVETIPSEATKYGMEVRIISDQKILNREYPFLKIDSLGLNQDPDFRTRYGETAPEAVVHAVAYAEFQAWRDNDPTQKSRRSGTSFEAYWKMVQEAKAGTRDWTDVQFLVSANDLTTPNYDLAKHTFLPGRPVTIIFTSGSKDTTIKILAT